MELNNVEKRCLPIPESVQKGLEREVKITDFEILKELGIGTFGRVYLVRHKVTKRDLWWSQLTLVSERQEERLEPSLEREGAGSGLKSLLTKKGLGLMEDLMKEGWMVGRSYEGCWGENRALEESMRSFNIVLVNIILLREGTNNFWDMQENVIFLLLLIILFTKR